MGVVQGVGVYGVTGGHANGVWVCAPCGEHVCGGECVWCACVIYVTQKHIV